MDMTEKDSEKQSLSQPQSPDGVANESAGDQQSSPASSDQRRSGPHRPRTRKEIHEALNRETEASRRLRNKKKAQAAARELHRKEMMKVSVPQRTIVSLICGITIVIILFMLQQQIRHNQQGNLAPSAEGVFQKALEGDLEAVKKAVEHDPSLVLYPEDGTGKTLLHYATLSGDIDLVRFIIENRPRVNHQDAQGCTALHYAAEKGFTEICQLLINAGAYNRISNKIGLRPLHLAAQGGHTEICRILLNESAKVYDLGPMNMRALHFAVMYNHLDTAELLLKYRANPNAINRHGKTPLYLAVLKKNKAMVKLLLRYGALVDPGNGTKTALDLAREQNDQELIQILEEALKKQKEHVKSNGKVKK
ncbi:MAG: ankyrin repeat domain-containing protein [Lentisphaerae bacterium]|nr:MAG: ankyrin repeat domain-containing protein [Lentisphaerota bacterium]